MRLSSTRWRQDTRCVRPRTHLHRVALPQMPCLDSDTAPSAPRCRSYMGAPGYSSTPSGSGRCTSRCPKRRTHSLTGSVKCGVVRKWLGIPRYPDWKTTECSALGDEYFSRPAKNGSWSKTHQLRSVVNLEVFNQVSHACPRSAFWYRHLEGQ